jgi:hypothetical protein
MNLTLLTSFHSWSLSKDFTHSIDCTHLIIILFTLHLSLHHCSIDNCHVFRYCGHGVLASLKCDEVARFYLSVRREAAVGSLCDGAGHRVHFNMRVLVRALK